MYIIYGRAIAVRFFCFFYAVRIVATPTLCYPVCCLRFLLGQRGILFNCSPHTWLCNASWSASSDRIKRLSTTFRWPFVRGPEIEQRPDTNQSGKKHVKKKEKLNSGKCQSAYWLWSSNYWAPMSEASTSTSAWDWAQYAPFRSKCGQSKEEAVAATVAVAVAAAVAAVADEDK